MHYHLGLTRSASRRGYLLHTPDAFVRTPLPGLRGGMAVVHVAPEMGADFAMSTVEFEAGGELRQGPAQRFLYVLEGEVMLSAPEPVLMTAGDFVYVPTGQAHTVSAQRVARVLMIEKRFQSLHQGELLPLVRGREDAVTPTPLDGNDDLQVRALLPALPGFDFAVNTMTYAPGASLAQVEVHYMEHGLLMLAGGGIYRLGDNWHPVTAGDAIWMAPFCPQWFAAVGKVPARYIIYKNLNRHVLA